GRGLAQSQKVEAEAIDLFFQLVNLPVLLNQLPGQGGVSLDQRLHGLSDHLFRLAAHEEQFFPQILEFVLVVPGGVFHNAYPNLPVMYSSVRVDFGFLKIFLVSSYSISSPCSKNAV